MSAEQDELAALRAEVAALREEIRQMRAALPVPVAHHCCPPAPVPLGAPYAQPGMIPWHQQQWMTGRAAGLSPSQMLQVIVP